MVTITNDELSDLLRHDVRYCLGRLTWVPDDCAKRLRRHWRHVLPEIRAVIVRDVREHLERKARAGVRVTERIDAETWRPLLEWMEVRL